MQTNDIWNLVTDFLKRGDRKTAYNTGFAFCRAGFAIPHNIIIRICNP